MSFLAQKGTPDKQDDVEKHRDEAKLNEQLILILKQKRLLISCKRSSWLTPLPPVSIIGGRGDELKQSRLFSALLVWV